MAKKGKGPGWHGESRRHEMAARGLKSTWEGIDRAVVGHARSTGRDIDKLFARGLEKLGKKEYWNPLWYWTLTSEQRKEILRHATDPETLEKFGEEDYLNIMKDRYRINDDDTEEMLTVKELVLKEVKNEIDNMTDAEEEALEAINEDIKKRTRYGLRKEFVDDDSYILTWSNAGARWQQWGKPPEGENVFEVDANEVVIHEAHAGVAEKFFFLLDDLPLYQYSYEAGERGIAPPGAKKDWAMLQLEKQLRELAEKKEEQ